MEGCSLIGCLRSRDWAHTQGHMGSANGTRWAMRREKKGADVWVVFPMCYIAQLRAAEIDFIVQNWKTIEACSPKVNLMTLALVST